MSPLRFQRRCPACGQFLPQKLERGGTFFAPTTHCPLCKEQIAPNNLSEALQVLAFIVVLAPMFFWQHFQEPSNTTRDWLTLAFLGVGAAIFIASRAILRYVPVSRPV
jgi:hypothetical protein